MSKLTDKMLAQLYLDLASDYKELTDLSYDANRIYQHMYTRLYDSLNNPSNILSTLEEGEKLKAWNVLNTYFAASPHYRSIPKQQQTVFFHQEIRIIIHPLRPRYYCYHNDFFLEGLLFRTYVQLFSYVGYSLGEHIAKLVLRVLALIAAIAACYALFCLVDFFLIGMERLIFNEGWLQASINMAAMLGGAAAGALFGVFVGSSLITSLALAVGIANPVGLVIAGTVCFTLITSALTTWLTNLIQNEINLSNNPDAIDPYDAMRYRLTDEEADNLLAKGIDPVKVRCAIVALREKMGRGEAPSMLNYLFTENGSEKRTSLNLIRQLRRGELTFVEVNDKMTFDLLMPVRPYYVPPMSSEQQSQSSLLNLQDESDYSALQF